MIFISLPPNRIPPVLVLISYYYIYLIVIFVLVSNHQEGDKHTVTPIEGSVFITHPIFCGFVSLFT